ncbi:hypothetical protein C2I17_11050 [Niallia circulans]|nr:hypothetical protein C2I17_11050 [Niallia circulans]
MQLRNINTLFPEYLYDIKSITSHSSDTESNIQLFLLVIKIDATIADIYLVSSFDVNKVIGRPVPSNKLRRIEYVSF